MERRPRGPLAHCWDLRLKTEGIFSCFHWGAAQRLSCEPLNDPPGPSFQMEPSLGELLGETWGRQNPSLRRRGGRRGEEDAGPTAGQASSCRDGTASVPSPASSWQTPAGAAAPGARPPPPCRPLSAASPGRPKGGQRAVSSARGQRPPQASSRPRPAPTRGQLPPEESSRPRSAPA